MIILVWVDGLAGVGVGELLLQYAVSPCYEGNKEQGD